MNKALRESAAYEIARNAMVGVTDAPGLDKVTGGELQKLADAITTQDPWWKSKRVHASIAGVAAVFLTAVGLQMDEGQIMEILGAVSSLVTIALPLWSKASDARAVRESPP